MSRNTTFNYAQKSTQKNSRLKADTPHAFICSHCGNTVIPHTGGSENRNHCPNCLWSIHADLRKGDRLNRCKGDMEPIGIWVKESGEWSLLHRCTKCGFIRSNRIAGDDNEMILFALAAKPISTTPFPAQSTITKISESTMAKQVAGGEEW